MMVTPLTLRSRKAGDTFTVRVNGIGASIASQFTVRRMVTTIQVWRTLTPVLFAIKT